MEAKARAAAEKAIALDNALAEPHAVLGVVNAAEEYDWLGADAEFEKAFERDPNHATAHHWCGYMLMVRGRVAEAHEKLQNALRLDPLNSAIMVAAAGPLNYSGRYREALQQVRKQLELDPHSYYALWGMGEAYANMGKFDMAASAYRDALAVTPGNPYIVARLCYALGMGGHRNEALKLLREMQQSRKGKYLSGGLESWAYAGLGTSPERSRHWKRHTRIAPTPCSCYGSAITIPCVRIRDSRRSPRRPVGLSVRAGTAGLCWSRVYLLLGRSVNGRHQLTVA